MTGLAPRQAEAMRFIGRFILGNGYPPTLREICDGIGIRSSNGANDHLMALERKGMLRAKPMISRGIVLTDQGRAWLANDIENNPGPAEPEPVEPEPVTKTRGWVA